MDWRSFLLGKENWHFLLNACIRTTVMFLVILVALRLLGKRGIHQLSVFELGVIIGLGSAAGDPMLYQDVGILPSVVVFIVVVLMYRLITYLISANDKFETLIQGRATYILRNGVMLETFKRQPLALDEFFATLRQNQVYHLGQVRYAIIESDGKLSIFYFADDEVKYGLPILPDVLDSRSKSIADEGVYSCTSCGNTERLKPGNNYRCAECNHTEWLPSLNGVRIK
jgi:uncharacterized membrane protein YcaP (DUF421 family)